MDLLHAAIMSEDGLLVYVWPASRHVIKPPTEGGSGVGSGSGGPVGGKDFCVLFEALPETFTQLIHIFIQTQSRFCVFLNPEVTRLDIWLKLLVWFRSSSSEVAPPETIPLQYKITTENKVPRTLFEARKVAVNKYLFRDNQTEMCSYKPQGNKPKVYLV